MRILSSYNVSAKPVFVRPIKLHLAAIGFLFGATIAQSLADPASGKSGKQFCVCIDPGHPSENNDGGAVTNGLREVTVNWEVALLLRDELGKDGMKVVMTKKSEGDFVTNKDRAAIANESDADLFLRLHADAGKSTGFTIYYPRKEGTVHGVTGPSKDVLQSSAAAAKQFHTALGATRCSDEESNRVRTGRRCGSRIPSFPRPDPSVRNRGTELHSAGHNTRHFSLLEFFLVSHRRIPPRNAFSFRPRSIPWGNW